MSAAFSSIAVVCCNRRGRGGEERLNDLALRHPNEKIHTFCTLCDGESGITDHTGP